MKKIIPYDDYNKRIAHPRQRETVGAVKSTFGVIAFRNGWKLIEKDMAKVYNVNGITLVGKIIPEGSGGTGYDQYANLLIEYDNGESQEITIGYYYRRLNQVFEELYDRLYGCDNPKETHELLCNAIIGLVGLGDFGALPIKYRTPKRGETKSRKIYRIRKLTARECFRLMGVSDADIDKIKAANISESQQYKLAGNSIVVNVLEGIFTQMFRSDSDVLF